MLNIQRYTKIFRITPSVQKILLNDCLAINVNDEHFDNVEKSRDKAIVEFHDYQIPVSSASSRGTQNFQHFQGITREIEGKNNFNVLRSGRDRFGWCPEWAWAKCFRHIDKIGKTTEKKERVL